MNEPTSAAFYCRNWEWGDCVLKRLNKFISDYSTPLLFATAIYCGVLGLVAAVAYRSAKPGFGATLLLVATVLGILLVAICCLLSPQIKTPRDAAEAGGGLLARYQALAYTDRLTGMRNRLAFDEQVNELSQTLDKHWNIIFVNLDINHFKRINDTYGHVAGDRVLRVIARELHQLFDQVAYCYRLGGDEFCLLAVDHSAEEMDKLLTQLNPALDRNIVDFPVSTAYGLAEYNRFLHPTLLDVYKQADINMYENKQKQKARQPAGYRK